MNVPEKTVLEGLTLINTVFQTGAVSPEVIAASGIAATSSFVGSILDFATTDFADFLNWIYCDGRLLEASKYLVLFKKIGYKFGGSGSNFAIPDLRGLVVACTSATEPIGKKEGAKTHTLKIGEMPSHNHTNWPFDRAMKMDGWNRPSFTSNASGNQPNTLDSNMMNLVGGNQPHNNMQPTIYLG